MTAALRRSARQQLAICTRGCNRPATDGDYCADCAARVAEHRARSAYFNRLLRRDNGLCAECPAGVHTPSSTYRCPACAEKLKLQRETGDRSRRDPRSRDI